MLNMGGPGTFSYKILDNCFVGKMTSRKKAYTRTLTSYFGISLTPALVKLQTLPRNLFSGKQSVAVVI